jgi:hypothetical protein
MPWREEMTHELTTAAPPDRSAIISTYAGLTGISRTHLYRLAKECGFDSGRKPRADKGTLKSGINVEQMKFVAGLIHETRREVKGPIMPVARALEIAADSGIIEPGQISTSRMHGLLRERQITAAALKADRPYTPMRSLHPNHVHVLDASVCIQYYLRDGKRGQRLAMMDERDYYKNKPANFAKIKTRLLRYALVDHFSGAIYWRYYNTTGETMLNLFDFVCRAWGRKEDARYPFRGVPLILLMDAGSANISRAIVSFLSRLEVDVPKGNPYNASRQGAVETIHDVIEGWFESGLRIQPAHTEADLNAWAEDYMVRHNAERVHRRHKMTRTACWLLIRAEQLRELPDRELLNELLSYTDDEMVRTVDREYAIHYKGDYFSLKHVPGVLPGRSRVQIIIKPYTPEAIGVRYNDETYEAQPVRLLPREEGVYNANAAIIGQEYKAQPESLTQKAVKEFDTMAYGEPDENGKRPKDAVPFEGLRVFGHHADTVDAEYMPRKGTPIEVDRSIAARQIPFTLFLKDLIHRTGRVTPEMNQALRAELGEWIDATRADEVIREIEDGRWKREEGSSGHSEETAALPRNA